MVNDKQELSLGKPNVRVHLRDNPGRQGFTTGNVRKSGSFEMIEVNFGPNERIFKRLSLLEIVKENVSSIDIFKRGSFGKLSDLRRILTLEKIKGELTNIFYSMESSNTDFYPHQFKPVLRFIESPEGRLLLADEVGLGKTIEATYIWKEIQARHAARRLLIVCPAMLREKWKVDLRVRFNISSEICDAKQTFEKVSKVANHNFDESFVIISSLEGLRTPAHFESNTGRNARTKFAQLLDQNTRSSEFALFDCVIIDEAHYLRNPDTATHRLGRLLSEAARHFILLTATPIQIKSENLYQLLRLIDQNEFYNKEIFQDMLDANSLIVRAQRQLWNREIPTKEVLDTIDETKKSVYFKNDKILNQIKKKIQAQSFDDDQRIESLRMLESRSLLSHYMTRSRKREVIKDRVKREAVVLSLNFSQEEEALYNHVTEKLRHESFGQSPIAVFSLIVRQRQMASSIVGALRSWNQQGITKEMLWEDFGQVSLENSADPRESDSEVDESIDTVPIAYGLDFDMKTLVKNDSKYNELRDFLKKQLKKSSKEKFVIFAYFRGTLKYLEERLKQDGISCALMMGSMPIKKEEIIEDFASKTGPSVLLSSEVGSEGIDLQFCRFIINYDLPWNPMRVEQRIGRLDRLGQKAEKISIINLMVENTIEDRILMRLYERIKVFEESIGDIEEILGDTTKKLMVEFFNQDLSDEEREEKYKEAELIIENVRKENLELEKQAVNLLGFSDYILNQIEDSRERGRWLSGNDLISLVDDFFELKFPGTKIDTNYETLESKIMLSENARDELGNFIYGENPVTRTRMHTSKNPITSFFNPRKSGVTQQGIEFIDPTHPLITWIKHDFETSSNQLHNVVAIKQFEHSPKFESGDYVFRTELWSFKGLRNDTRLVYQAIHVDTGNPLSANDSEELVSNALQQGGNFPNAKNLLKDVENYVKLLTECGNIMADNFGNQCGDFELENETRCEQQKTSAEKFAERKLSQLEGRIERYEQEGKSRVIPMTKGLIEREERQLKDKLLKIEKSMVIDPTHRELAIGVIRIE